MPRIRSCLKNVFLPDIGVGAAFQVLDILMYACGLKFGLALISSKNPNFEMGSGTFSRFPVCNVSR